MLTRQTYLDIVNAHIKNKNLVKHCLAVEAAMRALARHFQEDEDVWGLAGLIHDADWEETANDITLHTKKTIEWLKEHGEDDTRIIETVLAHNYKNNGHEEPKDTMQWALYTCDELTGLIIATTLVRPDKQLTSVTVESVLKKFPAKAFAAGVDREQIKLCEEKLGIPIHDFVNIILTEMQGIHTDLGL
ncbi:MAG: HDIG domain-containing protein [Candidatus Roizmanbacteria bacterium]|nr:HDIG domain-containing protein [Candidatus Roizmanbacteria bacterium]